MTTAISKYNGLLICAAGNSNLDLDAEGSTKVYPACLDLPNILVVGAIDSNVNKLGTSNYGQTYVDIFALGEGIYTTSSSGGYTTISGTSAATPFVSGVAALMLSYKPTISPIEIKMLSSTVQRLSLHSITCAFLVAS